MKCRITREYFFTKEDKEEILKQVKSMSELARKMGYSRSYVCDVLNGKQMASAKFVYFLIQHVNINELHYYEEEKPVLRFY